jgi:hypothetical protein
MASIRGICLLGSLFLLSTGAAKAEIVHVEKVKGNKAVIRLPVGMRVESGQELQVGASSRLPASKGSEGREHKIGGTAEISSLSSSNGTTSTNSTTIGVSGTYGWNTGTWEYGPQFLLTMLSSSTSMTIYAIGGFVDYNLTPNMPGVDFLWGAGGSAGLNSSSGGGTSSSGMSFFAGGFNKWFPIGHPVSLRTDLGLSYSQSGSTVKTTQTGLLAKAGFEVYF